MIGQLVLCLTLCGLTYRIQCQYMDKETGASNGTIGCKPTCEVEQNTALRQLQVKWTQIDKDEIRVPKDRTDRSRAEHLCQQWNASLIKALHPERYLQLVKQFNLSSDSGFWIGGVLSNSVALKSNCAVTKTDLELHCLHTAYYRECKWLSFLSAAKAIPSSDRCLVLTVTNKLGPILHDTFCNSTAYSICIRKINQTAADEDFNRMLEEMALNMKRTRKYQRTGNSANDDRPSARAIGSVAVVICVAIPMVISLLDLPRLVNLFKA